MRSMTTLNPTQCRHDVPVSSRIWGHIDAMWCEPTVANPFAYTAKRHPRPTELLLT